MTAQHKVIAYPHPSDTRAIAVLPEQGALPKKEAQRLAQAVYNTGKYQSAQVVEVVTIVQSKERSRVESQLASL